MGRTILGCFCVVIVAPIAFAGDPSWVRVSENATMLVYVDAASVKHRGGMLSAWVMFDFLKTQKTAEYTPKQYRSSVQLQLFDCASERSGPVSVTYYTSDSGQGDVAQSWAIDPKEATLTFDAPGTIGLSLNEFVCLFAKRQGKAEPSSPRVMYDKASQPAKEPS